MSRRIMAVIMACTGDSVIIGEAELQHAVREHNLSQQFALELIKMILRDPSDVFVEQTAPGRKHIYFYRKVTGRFFVIVVKQNIESSFFCSVYTTGAKIKPKHQRTRRLM